MSTRAQTEAHYRYVTSCLKSDRLATTFLLDFSFAVGSFNSLPRLYVTVHLFLTFLYFPFSLRLSHRNSSSYDIRYNSLFLTVDNDYIYTRLKGRHPPSPQGWPRSWRPLPRLSSLNRTTTTRTRVIRTTQFTTTTCPFTRTTVK